MIKSKGGRPSKQEIKLRRDNVKELMLKGKTTNAIATSLGIHPNTVRGDIEYLQAHYTKLVLNNPHLAEKQFARVEALISEVQYIKDEYWSLFEEVKTRVEDSRKKEKEWEDNLEQAKKDLEKAKEGGDRKIIREARRDLDYAIRPIKTPTYVSTRIDTLKAILDRVDKEAKLLSLFNPQQLIEKNYVSINVLQTIMEVFKTTIMHLIPIDKRTYAFKRLKTIDIKALNGESIIDNEVFNKPIPKAKEIKETEIEDDIDLSEAI